MLERIRLLISQIVTSIIVAVSTIWFCRNVMINTGIINRFYSYRLNSVSITLSIGLLTIAILAMKIILWLIREPMLEQEEIDMGTVENIPQSK